MRYAKCIKLTKRQQKRIFPGNLLSQTGNNRHKMQNIVNTPSFLLQNTWLGRKKLLPLQRVFHGIRFKVN